MKSLVVVAHGSRRASSNDEVRLLCEHLSKKLDGSYSSVRAGFLELAEPSIPDAISDTIKEGVKQVVVLPYFLSAGRHVVEDVPAEVNKVRDEHPEVDIEILDHLGGMPELVGLMYEAVTKD